MYSHALLPLPARSTASATRVQPLRGLSASGAAPPLCSADFTLLLHLEQVPVYGETLEDNGRFNEQPVSGPPSQPGLAPSFLHFIAACVPCTSSHWCSPSSASAVPHLQGRTSTWQWGGSKQSQTRSETRPGARRNPFVPHLRCCPSTRTAPWPRHARSSRPTTPPPSSSSSSRHVHHHDSCRAFRLVACDAILSGT